MPKMMPREVIIVMALELKLNGQNAATMKIQRMMFCFETILLTLLRPQLV